MKALADRPPGALPQRPDRSATTSIAGSGAAGTFSACRTPGPSRRRGHSPRRWWRPCSSWPSPPRRGRRNRAKRRTRRSSPTPGPGRRGDAHEVGPDGHRSRGAAYDGPVLHTPKSNKFHRPNCPTLNNSANAEVIPSVDDAVEEGPGPLHDVWDRAGHGDRIDRRSDNRPPRPILKRGARGRVPGGSQRREVHDPVIVAGLAVLAAMAALTAYRWSKALDELGRRRRGARRRDAGAAGPVARRRAGRATDPALRRGRRPARTAGGAARTGPPAAQRRAQRDGRGGHRHRRPPPPPLRQRQRRPALRARARVRSAGSSPS